MLFEDGLNNITMTHAEVAALIQDHVNGAIAANNQHLQDNNNLNPGGSPHPTPFRKSKEMATLGFLLVYSFLLISVPNPDLRCRIQSV